MKTETGIPIEVCGSVIRVGVFGKAHIAISTYSLNREYSIFLRNVVRVI